ncbi:pitrilysin family protein [Sphingomonas sp. LY160]|uniref:M16 family metallopeptidase n=1 Tax=Sphingomonas sp. LY160 TaxID=3095342 RepID=UPI002ADEBDF8|nr:pitrilysin family protein [Sphingomonas sp. LY160]MEA1072216.1 pitrilysin family protein [Sphingomonas sp. LY160]
MTLTARRLSLLLASASLLAACQTTPTTTDIASAPPAAPAEALQAEPVPVTQLASAVTIPHQRFVLDNGLTVIVHEDRKAPVVGVAMWYNVGAKDEPKGKTGFAHLFEHLMFNGSENLPGDFFEYLQQIGATDYNGTTNSDRTNYFQTVPRGALDRALFMESDRMGHLLGAVTQGNLDNQRGVVQNEKRQGDNRPGGLVFYEVLKNVFPDGHPYQHSTIGSMADLDAASLADVGKWFTDKYGPNNAVLVLAGDLNAAEARPLVQKYFGSIPRGPVNNPAQAAVPVLAAPKSMVMKDNVAAVQVSRWWPAPGLLDPRLAALDVGGSVLGGLASSRLDEVLVRNEKIATGVQAGLYAFQRVGIFNVQATVKPGVDPALVERRLDELVAEYIANGPTEEEVRRAALSEVGGKIRGLEQVGGFGGKAVTLAEGQTFAGDSDWYAKNLATYAAITPAAVTTAMREYLSKPAFSLRLEPGQRAPYQEAASVGGKAAKLNKDATAARPGPKREVPPVGTLSGLDFPDVTKATLSNGIEIQYAQRNAVPVTQMALSFDAGEAADVANGRGLQSMVMTMLDEGTTSLSSQKVAEAKESLGVEIEAGSSLDRSTVSMSALSANLGPSLALMGDIVKNPAFDPAELERVRTQRLTAIKQVQKDPNGIGQRVLPALLYGPNHPYAVIAGGDEAAISRFSRDDLVAFKDGWLRPDRAKIFVVSDRPLSEIQPLIEAEFGRWATPTVPAGVKNFTAPPARPSQARIVLVNRPDSPQSVILGGQLTPADPRNNIEALTSANDVLGGNFLSRINMDLRESKGWSYGVRGSAQLSEKSVPYFISAPVQADRTGDSLVALNEQIGGFLGNKGVTGPELTRTIANRINMLPGQYETSEAVLGAMMSNDLFGRPLDYQESLAAKYRGYTAASLDQAIRGAVDPKGFVWVVVGDAAKVKPQLDKLGLPVEVIQPR